MQGQTCIVKEAKAEREAAMTRESSAASASRLPMVYEMRIPDEADQRSGMMSITIPG